MKKHALKAMPSLKSDEEAEQFVESADLSQYDLSDFKPMRFEIAEKKATLNIRIPQNLLDAVKVKAKIRGIPYSRYIRSILEQDIAT
ncbi:MAG: BrnA antitoxin family protein [Desulfovibrio sp.]|jgi:predicted DNA binding CopG/RHH family protein|nr:BrnA antitoxin family protein [Desulfovibrio sp.]